MKRREQIEVCGEARGEELTRDEASRGQKEGVDSEANTYAYLRAYYTHREPRNGNVSIDSLIHSLL